MSERGLRARNVTYAYGQHVAVKDADLDLAPGDTAALVGPNGSGKTTLLQLLSGTRRPGGGTVQLDGLAIDRLSPRARAHGIAVVSQHVDPALPLTVHAVVALGRTAYGGLLRPLSQRDRLALDDAMEATDVRLLRNERFNELSGGEQRRVALAMAIAQGTSYLLLDEPTVHLDLHHQHAFFELLGSLRATRNIGVLAVMHDLNLAALYFDTLVVMQDGQIKARGKPSSVLTDPAAMSVFRAPLETVMHPQTGVPQVLLQRGTGRD